VKKTYFDIVPRRKGVVLSADDLREALRCSGFAPLDKGAFNWRSPHKGDSMRFFILTFPESSAFYSNTRSLVCRCPVCGSDLSSAHWLRNKLNSGIHGYKFVSECCGSVLDIRELIYDPPVYFSKTALTVLNEDSQTTPPVDVLRDLEQALGEELECLERIC
jgi:hypothetical protein